MSDLNLTTVTAPPPVQAPRPAEPPKPPKSQSDHKPVNTTTAAHGPAVVLSGALAKPTDKGAKSPPQGSPPTPTPSPTSGQPAQTNSVSLGLHANYVV
ncbi:MAG TPA: hypothetical protein VNW53_08325 [Phenylobacterium sp.]|jgi:hypothetical protein|uniref:hypothetical protein n=1 Tax=Phenylobacterium sp. TaxID=1871053 RepID=UPI002D03C0B8|nr:hypothetical protein [Phenylobacterium sp.]HXA38989.1 hypothetical protein [Phenylobacterium sp.]